MATIAVKEKNGNLKPVYESGETGKKRIILTKASPDQTRAVMPYYRVEGDKTYALGSHTISDLYDWTNLQNRIELNLDLGADGKLLIKSPDGLMQFRLDTKAVRAIAAESGPSEQVPEQPAPKPLNPFQRIAFAVYGLFLLAIIFFLMSQTFDWLSLEALFGIKF